MTLTDKQKQEIKQEAEKLYPYVWPKNKEWEDFTPRPGQGAPFSNKVKKLQAAYIAGATAHALACIQKDEEIGRLTGLLNLAAQKLVAAQTALMNIRDFESHNEAWEDVVDMKLIAEKYFNTNHP